MMLVRDTGLSQSQAATCARANFVAAAPHPIPNGAGVGISI
jgi:hypothetical protein